jgi:hypothetical protein
MSNSFTSPPLLTDASRVVAGQTIRTAEIARLADSSNYAFATGGTSNVLSQTWDDSTFRQDGTSFVEMCQWYIPQISSSHQTLNIILSAFCATAGAQTKFSLTLGSNTYTTTLTITDTSRYSSAFVSGAINITAFQNDFAGLLKMEVKAPTGGEVEVLGVMANWSPLTSPLATGQHFHQLSEYIPQGQARLSADLPLSSRTGVELINNINTLRRRPRVLFNWSGVEGVSSGSGISSAGAVAQAIGDGDLNSLFSESAIFPGMRDDSTLDITAYVHVLQNGGSYTPLSIDLLGERITMNSAGWTTHSLSFRLDELQRSNEFGLSMYRIGPDDTEHNRMHLYIKGTDIDGSSGAFKPYLAGLTIIGV